MARYTLLPDRSFVGGCDAFGAVQLSDIGTPLSNVGAMTCRLADPFTDWVQRDVQTAARDVLGVRVTKVESMGTYACRNVNGAASGRLSQHAHANAVDISAFLLSDGRRISIAQNWSDGSDAEQFLHKVHDAACHRFVTVLSPDYNALHHDHLHFDMGGKAFCR